MSSKGKFLDTASKDYLKRIADEYLEISGRKMNTDKMTKPQLIKFFLLLVKLEILFE